MKKSLLFILLLLALQVNETRPCNICGGGTGDLVVLALDGRMLFNAGLFYDSYIGRWDQRGTWREFDYTENQYRFSFSGAYRFNRHLQGAITIPYVMNYNNIPEQTHNGSGIGDISLSGRYEFFHEFQVKRKNNKDYIDNKLPYLAITFGLTLPTGKSEENADSEVGVTGKGYFVSSLGVSLTKTIIKNHLQVSTDISWQHSFKKTYEKYYNIAQTPFEKQQGDKFNYSASFNYIFNNWHALTLSVTGSNQSASMYEKNSVANSEERNLNFMFSYTYYPSTPFRITPSIKWTLPQDNMGKNASGSTTFGVNLTYYFADYDIK
ncbi:MAG: hypothetical protein EHM58_12630 [Ignavibacteriae bacterium]|nr:MAG: hypothetical protein EHM58_12630 [Ignavibacteriota bacterium]